MNVIKTLSHKRSKKSDREQRVLMGLVELYLKTGKPIGSHTLKESGFEDLSPATIRNYFAQLEEEGYLTQQHSSGGRLPTALGIKTYVNTLVDNPLFQDTDYLALTRWPETEAKEVAAFLPRAAEKLSETTGYAVCLSAPRFDHDFILDMKLVAIDHYRTLCLIITDFGLVKMEILYAKKKFSLFALKRIEQYFLWRLTGRDKPHLEEGEEEVAKKLYEEVMVRYIVNYANFSTEDIHRTGLSQLLLYPEFNDPLVLANALALFESPADLQKLLQECQERKQLCFWIGDDLAPYKPSIEQCALLAIPYRINQTIVGAVALFGPMRLPYRRLFGALNLFSDSISDYLTKSLYKFKLEFRQPNNGMAFIDSEEKKNLTQSSLKLLDIKE